ncbi:L,D-transpeptidase family protein [Streptomyces sp. TRM49041]|uniref:L,D-transpeptidase family protein n=1 Tax=Streptomyces sp. TRM49041 TaxID=2603216 RepID=UPI0011EDE4E1|nr:L,D-transpeptidase family protein [Streptomyces sp. TRM49041]
MPASRRPRRRLVVAAVLLIPLLPLTACADADGARGDSSRPAAGAPGAPGVPGDDGQAGRRATAPASPASPAAPAGIPGLGPATRGGIPEKSRQAVVVRGDDQDANTSTVTLYERHATEGWKAVSDPWPAHNGLKGWTDHHTQDDLRSPIGVFGLTDAGGLLPDPGTKLPYDQDHGFTIRGTGALGEPLEGSFDYVVAINYNRRPGTSPLDWTRPLGAERGGGIWLHVDHEGPTQGCVSLKEPRMRELLKWLDPAAKPVVVMGDVTSLGR